MVNGRRTVYIPVTKRADASTLAVVERIQAALPTFRAAVPDDIQISFELDQSTYVTNAINAVVVESVVGTMLTGFVLSVCLQSWLSAVIVVVTIPFALLSAVLALWGGRADHQSHDLRRSGPGSGSFGGRVDRHH